MNRFCHLSFYILKFVYSLLNPFIINNSLPLHPAHTTHDAHLLVFKLSLFGLYWASLYGHWPLMICVNTYLVSEKRRRDRPKSPFHWWCGGKCMLRFTIILLLLDVGVCHYCYHCINSLHLTSHLYFLANIFLKLTETLSLFAVWTCVIFVHLLLFCCCCFLQLLLFYS